MAYDVEGLTKDGCKLKIYHIHICMHFSGKMLKLVPLYVRF